MKQLLIIFCIDSEDDVCRLFLPYWRRSGCDLIFSSPLDAPSKLEGVSHVHFGRKLTGLAEDNWFYQQQYDAFIFSQYDSICLGPLPEIRPFESIHWLACGPSPEFEWGWSANSIDTPSFVLCARQAIANGCLFIHGVKDRSQLEAILDNAPVEA